MMSTTQGKSFSFFRIAVPWAVKYALNQFTRASVQFRFTYIYCNMDQEDANFLGY